MGGFKRCEYCRRARRHVVVSILSIEVGHSSSVLHQCCLCNHHISILSIPIRGRCRGGGVDNCRSAIFDYQSNRKSEIYNRQSNNPLNRGGVIQACVHPVLGIWYGYCFNPLNRGGVIQARGSEMTPTTKHQVSIL